MINAWNRIWFILILFGQSAYGQYWQQDVSYEMDLFLHTDTKILEAHSDFSYVNHSPDTLGQMLMHLYHNAFNEGTILHDVWTEFGDGLDFSKGWTGIEVKGIQTDSMDYHFRIRDDTILDIDLPQALLPGDTLRFSMDWQLKLHPHIDRSGWRGDEFDFSQWYPKFVVYDENGWHDDPFGDWGEFYGEFGDFTVHINVPRSHVVGASGVVTAGDPGWSQVMVDTSLSWEDWSADFEQRRAKQMGEMPDSLRRTVTFHAQEVHDFAWVTSSDFVYEHGTWDGIDIHVLFPLAAGSKWSRDVVRFGISAIEWLSTNFGRYPWPQMTVTNALIGGGMEYPMLVMDGSESEGLTVHEIGHNWFYGIMGNDELDDAWLDEGFTTFQTRWYTEKHYPDNDYDLTRGYVTEFELRELQRQMYGEADFKPLLRYLVSGDNEPLAQHSYDFSGYGSYRDNVYTKSSYMLEILRNYLGEERFLAGMRLYFDRWALKHVNEDRFIKAMEDGAGEELDWYFDQWLHTTKLIDYVIEDFKVEQQPDGSFVSRISCRNKGGFFLPLPVTVFGAEGQRATGQLRDWKFRKSGVVEIKTDFKPLRAYADADNLFYDIDRRNNDTKFQHQWRYNYKDWDAYPDNRNLYLWKPQFSYGQDAGAGIGARVDRVYRNTGESRSLGLDLHTGSGQVDAEVAFRERITASPVNAIIFGHARTWQHARSSAFAYEMSWSRENKASPLHYLTLQADHARFTKDVDLLDDPQMITRLGFKYEFQQPLLKGGLGASLQLWQGPAALGENIKSFQQLYLMGNWSQYFELIKMNLRLNLHLNDLNTPHTVMSQVASQPIRDLYFDRLASSLRDMGQLGSAYYLVGGGRMRGYADSLNVPVNFLMTSNLDLNFYDRLYKGHRLGISMFFDMGQISPDGLDWTQLADFGFGLEFKPSWKRTSWLTTLIRPRTLRLEIPLARTIDGQFSSSDLANTWLFSISN